MAGKVFSEEAVAAFRQSYPLSPVPLTHGLLDHPLLKLEALAEAAQRMRPQNVEYNEAVGLPISLPQDAGPSNGLSIVDTIRSIEENGSWMVLKLVQQLPEYRDLLHDTLAELRPHVAEATGDMLQLEGFIFISSPNAVTPLHFDGEYNILLQIRGSKTMTIFPADDEEIASQIFHETYHGGGQRNLAWRDEFAPRGRVFPLDPGKAVYVPVTAPHWVQNGPEVSISFSITWRSRWSFHQADAHGFNRRIRRFGFNPAPPPAFPRQNVLKALTHRALRKAEQVLSR